MPLRIWTCRGARSLAENIGHVYETILGSTFADIAATECYRLGRASYAVIANRPCPASESLDRGLIDAVAWFLHVDFGGRPGTTKPSASERAQAATLCGAGVSWESAEVRVRVPLSFDPDECFERWLALLLPSGWDPTWPATVDLEGRRLG